MASTTVTTRAQTTADASTVGKASPTLPVDQLRHIEQQLRRVAVLLAPHRRELDLIGQALKRWAATQPPSPYEYIREAFAEQANDIRHHWDQVGFYLQKAMEQIGDETGREVHS